MSVTITPENKTEECLYMRKILKERYGMDCRYPALQLIAAIQEAQRHEESLNEALKPVAMQMLSALRLAGILLYSLPAPTSDMDKHWADEIKQATADAERLLEERNPKR